MFNTVRMDDLKQPSFVNLKHAKPVQDLENLMLVDELVIFSLWLNLLIQSPIEYIRIQQ